MGNAYRTFTLQNLESAEIARATLVGTVPQLAREARLTPGQVCCVFPTCQGVHQHTWLQSPASTQCRASREKKDELGFRISLWAGWYFLCEARRVFSPAGDWVHFMEDQILSLLYIRLI